VEKHTMAATGLSDGLVFFAYNLGSCGCYAGFFPMQRCDISDQGLEHLSNMTALTFLTLRSSLAPITAVGCAHLAGLSLTKMHLNA
jgi:hypothetical protein